MADDRAESLRELELEYRYLGLVKLEANMARVSWLERLAEDLRTSLLAFWVRIEQAEK